MKVKPYNKMYLEDVADNLGSLLEYSVACGFNPITIWEMFVSSKVAIEIEKGNPKYIAGYSGREYLDIIINTKAVRDIKLSNNILSNEEMLVYDSYYWAGSTLAYYQYESGLTFYSINKYIPIQDVLEMYTTLHEADVRKFIDIANSRAKREQPETNLKILRKARDLTQQELADKSQVELRSIQMYEQRRNNINKAQADTLYKLSKILGCNIEDLLEY